MKSLTIIILATLNLFCRVHGYLRLLKYANQRRLTSALKYGGESCTFGADCAEYGIGVCDMACCQGVCKRIIADYASSVTGIGWCPDQCSGCFSCQAGTCSPYTCPTAPIRPPPTTTTVVPSSSPTTPNPTPSPTTIPTPAPTKDQADTYYPGVYLSSSTIIDTCSFVISGYNRPSVSLVKVIKAISTITKGLIPIIGAITSEFGKSVPHLAIASSIISIFDPFFGYINGGLPFKPDNDDEVYGLIASSLNRLWDCTVTYVQSVAASIRAEIWKSKTDTIKSKINDVNAKIENLQHDADDAERYGAFIGDYNNQIFLDIDQMVDEFQDPLLNQVTDSAQCNQLIHLISIAMTSKITLYDIFFKLSINKNGKNIHPFDLKGKAEEFRNENAKLLRLYMQCLHRAYYDILTNSKTFSISQIQDEIDVILNSETFCNWIQYTYIMTYKQESGVKKYSYDFDKTGFFTKFNKTDCNKQNFFNYIMTSFKSDYPGFYGSKWIPYGTDFMDGRAGNANDLYFPFPDGRYVDSTDNVMHDVGNVKTMGILYFCSWSIGYPRLYRSSFHHLPYDQKSKCVIEPFPYQRDSGSFIFIKSEGLDNGNRVILKPQCGDSCILKGEEIITAYQCQHGQIRTGFRYLIDINPNIIGFQFLCTDIVNLDSYHTVSVIGDKTAIIYSWSPWRVCPYNNELKMEIVLSEYWNECGVLAEEILEDTCTEVQSPYGYLFNYYNCSCKAMPIIRNENINLKYECVSV